MTNQFTPPPPPSVEADKPALKFFAFIHTSLNE